MQLHTEQTCHLSSYTLFVFRFIGSPDRIRSIISGIGEKLLLCYHHAYHEYACKMINKCVKHLHILISHTMIRCLHLNAEEDRIFF